MTTPQRMWTFSLVLDGFHEPTTAIEDALYEAGCDDALLSFSGNTPVLDFERTGESYEAAVLSAIEDLERAQVGATVLRVEPDDLVNAADIARRCSVSREAARLWIEGSRLGGEFPPPRARLGKSPVWSWYEVAGWLCERDQLEWEAVAAAQFLAALNALLERTRTEELVSRHASVEKELARLGVIAFHRKLAVATDE